MLNYGFKGLGFYLRVQGSTCPEADFFFKGFCCFEVKVSQNLSDPDSGQKIQARNRFLHILGVINL